MSKLMVEVKPDAVLVLGDTNSCLSVIGAKRLHIPIFHMEAGNRCKDECLPEETNRRIVDIISDVNRRQAESSAELARVLPRREPMEQREESDACINYPESRQRKTKSRRKREA